MDTQNAILVAKGESVAIMPGEKVVVGAKQLRKALERGAAKFVCLAKNADPAITEPIASQCQVLNIPYEWVGTMQELGSACGIDVGAAAAAALKS